MKTKNKVIITGKMLEMANVLKLVQTADCRHLLQTSIVESKNFVCSGCVYFLYQLLGTVIFQKVEKNGNLKRCDRNISDIEDFRFVKLNFINFLKATKYK